MICCQRLSVEKWIAPPQEDLPRPTWTKLFADGVMLSNSIEFAEWRGDLVEPMVCESCWSPGCAMAGLARIVRTSDQLIWLAPSRREIPERWQDMLAQARFLSEPVVISKSAWDDLRAAHPSIPDACEFPVAERRDMAALWLHEMPESIRVPEIEDLEPRLREALASDPLDMIPAIEVIRGLAARIVREPHAPVDGRITSTEAVQGNVNTFYFDGPPFAEWAAFVIGRDDCYVLGSGFVFVPDALSA